jgi:hypothetical protein
MNEIGSNTDILINVPLHWSNDVQKNSKFPIASTMLCVNYSMGVTGFPFCYGDKDSQTITASNVLISPTISQFSFGIKNLVSPPTVTT